MIFLAALQIGCGSDEDICRGAVEIGAELNLIGMRKADGSLWTWGQAPRDIGSQAGIRTRPTREMLETSPEFEFDRGTMCLRQKAGDVICPFFVDDYSPTFSFPDHAREISMWLGAGYYRDGRAPPAVCALSASGNLNCRWGRVGEVVSTERQAAIQGMALGADHFCSIGQNGKVACEPTDLGPVELWQRPPDELVDVVQIVSTGRAVCARTAVGEVWCWGNYDVQARRPLTQPTLVNDLAGPVVALVAGEQHVCALGSDGAVFCWGDDSAVVPGTNDRVTKRISGLPRPVTSLASARTAACAVLDDSTVWCWGANHYGQLGNQSMTAQPYVLPSDFDQNPPSPVVSCD